MHVAKAYALRGIEAAEDSSATNLGCSNLREKQKEAIVSFVSGKDVLVHLPTANESLFATLCCHGYRAYFTFLWHKASNNVLPDPLPWVGCGLRDYFHMALVLMRFRCASKPNRVECASDARWSCSHERQYLVDQLALPRLCTWLIDQRPSDTCLWSVCQRCNPPVSPSFAPLTSATTHTWHKTSLLLASLPREGFLSCDFLSTPTFILAIRFGCASKPPLEVTSINSLWMQIEIMRIHVNTTNAHPCLHVKGPVVCLL